MGRHGNCLEPLPASPGPVLPPALLAAAAPGPVPAEHQPLAQAGAGCPVVQVGVAVSHVLDLTLLGRQGRRRKVF